MSRHWLDLYHYTCADHGLPGITRHGLIAPNTHPLMAGLGKLIWLTDVADVEQPEQIGLTSSYLACDRLAYRFIVTTRAAVPWSALRPRVNPEVVTALEAFAQPEHWYVVRRPLTPSEFMLDTSYERATRPAEAESTSVPSKRAERTHVRTRAS